jgi:predicted esterase
VNPTLKRTLWWLLGIVVVVVVIGGGAILWWGTHPLGPGQGALAALQSDTAIRVTHAADGWEFVPASGVEPTTALVYYPGGHVDARSYAPYARAVAARGYLVVIPVMPLSLAVLNPNAAEKVVAAHPGVSAWGIGGHSLGGAMAATYAAKHPGTMRFLALFGSYPPAGSDLSATQIRVLTQVGTQDTVVNRENLAAGRKLLPADATYDDLEGGNHAQFGDYGPQPGDTANPAMSAAEQLRQAVGGTMTLLLRVTDSELQNARE